MKRLWTAAAILLLLLAACLASARYAGALTSGLTGRLEQAQEVAAQGDWEEAARLSREAFQLWQDHEFYLHVLMRHGDTDQIYRAFRALEQYLALEESDQYTAANADLIAQLELLSEMEQPSWENILEKNGLGPAKPVFLWSGYSSSSPAFTRNSWATSSTSRPSTST